MKLKEYKPVVSATINRKGVLDVDSVKGCSLGMCKYPNGGCYGLCYAAKVSNLYGYDFSKSVSREIIHNKKQLKIFNEFCGGYKNVFNMVKKHKLSWFRIGTMGDPCHNWKLTESIVRWLHRLKTPIIITKHWIKIPDDILLIFKKTNTIINTSISALDTYDEIEHRLNEYNRIRKSGVKSILRIVSCEFGKTEKGKYLSSIQNELFKNNNIIDNPLRIPKNDKRVLCGDIIVSKAKDLNSEYYISIFNKETYIGICKKCPDQCGAN